MSLESLCLNTDSSSCVQQSPKWKIFSISKLVLIYGTFIMFGLKVLVANVFHSSSMFDGLSIAAARVSKSCFTFTQNCHYVSSFGAQHEMKPAKVSLDTHWWLPEQLSRLECICGIIYWKCKPISEEGYNIKRTKIKSQVNLCFSFYYPRENTSRLQSLSELYWELFIASLSFSCVQMYSLPPIWFTCKIFQSLFENIAKGNDVHIKCYVQKGNNFGRLPIRESKREFWSLSSQKSWHRCLRKCYQVLFSDPKVMVAG